MRILLSAYACGPGLGSEPSTGWNAARELAREHDVWVLTSVLFRGEIERELHERPTPSLHFEFFDWPHWFRYPYGPRLGLELEYYAWQVAAYFRARRLHRQVVFDVAHHLTLGRYWSPSFLALLPIPFVWGPVGGGESAPRRFWAGLGFKGVLFELAREAARCLGEHDPFVRLAARRCSIALATTVESERRLKRLGARTIHLGTNVSLTPQELEDLGGCVPPPPAPIRFVSIGRLIPWKGFHLGLEAFASMSYTDAEYWIAGSGPEQPRLEDLARRCGVRERVRFLGQLPRRDIRVVLEQCHVLVHPSLHDSGGTVLIEAMAAGRPVVGLDTGGPAVLISDDVGVRVAVDEPRATVARLARTLDRLYASASWRRTLGEAARRRATDVFAARVWRDQLAATYRQSVRDCAERRPRRGDAAKAGKQPRLDAEAAGPSRSAR